MQKHYKLNHKELADLASGRGLCVTTDKIVVDGAPVGYMVREEPEDDQDSGWRFFAGDEDDKYIDNPKNFSLLDLNVLANYDQSIVPFIDAPVGAAFDKVEGEFYDASDEAGE
ncbi:DUF2185 domain-containing protein [Amantichitinum ursilacus]|uniref:Immunity protein Imm33 domain-containing protein n=1 Tax=Amantichitinum ursilacus TaxID=857265 RepID=A0A0N0XM55_9NEIS|nr:DUF2185 domain-containing protein [Amantichitinum ursilacus]KPC53897.1 hypothetical protein WG78_07235 [Amantichitinum ursilacus]